ncbi:redoxin domain-containing protein [bacterium]|nr:redoxin domain-containing protein [bacterium]
MIRKFILLALIFTNYVGASIEPKVKPEHPVAGQRISLEFDSLNAQEPVLIISANTPDTAIVEILSGKASGKGLLFSYTVPEKAVFLQYTVEDKDSTLMPEGIKFYGTPVYDKVSDKPLFDANRLYSLIYLDSRADHLAKARELLEKELELYPANWEAYVLLKRLDLGEGKTNEDKMAANLDSLLALKPDSLETLEFAALDFYMSYSAYESKASSLLASLAQAYPASKYWTDYQYSIYNFISQTPEKLGDFEREVFPSLKSEAKESAYFLLMSYALAGGRSRRIEDLANSFLKEFPNSTLAPAFIVTMLGSKYEQQNAEWAKKVEDWLKIYPEDPELNIQLAEYYRDKSWNTALVYYRKALKSSNLPQVAIVFAEASAEKEKNFAEASKAMKQAFAQTTQNNYRKLLWWEDFQTRQRKLDQSLIALYLSNGWLAFKTGNYENALSDLLNADSLLVNLNSYSEEVYRRLLAVSEKMGNLEARKIALVNLLIAQPDDESNQNLIKGIYLLEHQDTTGFGEWFFNEKLKVALRNRIDRGVPEFKIFDMAGKEMNIRDLAGKVVVINFWATWCQPCRQEIPQLNALVKDYKDNDEVVFISISKEDPKTVSDFLNENTFTYKIYLDDGQASTLFNVQSVPTHLVIDKKGKLQYEHIGSFPNLGQILSSEINALLENR